MINIQNRIAQDIYFTTTTVVDWVDIFTRPRYKHIIIESLQYCQQNKGLLIYAWVLMSNHLHMIVSAEGENTMSDILRDFKKHTNKEIMRSLESDIQESRREWMLNRFEYAARNDKKIKNYHFWQDGNDMQPIYMYDYLIQKLNYIHQNPVVAEIVDKPEEYKYSSAIDYAGGKGLLNVIIVQFFSDSKSLQQMAGDYKSPVTKPNLRISNSQERRIQALMPEYDYCYLGDNSRAYRPFGFNYVTLR